MTDHVLSASAARDLELAKLRKRRASRACMSCRERKVRCDVVLRSPKSCTNCDLDQARCTLAPKRGRKLPVAAASASNNTQSIINSSTVHNIYEDILQDLNSTTQGGDASNTPVTRAQNVLGTAQTFISCSDLGLEQTLDLADHSRGLTDGESFISSIFDDSPQSESSYDPIYPSATTMQHLPVSHEMNATPSPMDLSLFSGDDAMHVFKNFERLTEESTEPALGENLPRKYGPTESKITLGDLFKNALDVFQPSLVEESPVFPWVEAWPVQQLNEQSRTKLESAKALARLDFILVERLVTLYFQYFHPYFPVMNEREFHHLLHYDIQSDMSPPKSISLALLNAILFAASGFMLQEDAVKAGFSSIRSMSTAFYTRAKVLYDLGCESTTLGRAQICLLLSHRKTYGTHIFESEELLLEADRHLEKAGVPEILLEQKESTVELDMWRRLYGCWTLRMIGLTLATKRATALRRSINLNVPNVKLSALSDDVNFPWFLDVETKKRLAQMFTAKVALVRLVIPFCGFLIKVSYDATSTNIYHVPLITGKSDFALTEELETILTQWSLENTGVFEPSVASDMNDANRSAFLVQQGCLKLTYDYYISMLHQINLSGDNKSVTKWGARMKKLSRQALWESVTSTTRTLEDLLSKNLIQYLPYSTLACVLIPLTANNLFVKSSVRHNATSLQNLSTCARILHILAERYDAADFYFSLLDESLAITHKMMLDERAGKEQSRYDSQAEKHARYDSDSTEIRLPEADIYSVVMRFQCMSMSTGSVKTAKSSVFCDVPQDRNAISV